jgi:hypothetical protein
MSEEKEYAEEESSLFQGISDQTLRQALFSSEVMDWSIQLPEGCEAKSWAHQSSKVSEY